MLRVILWFAGCRLIAIAGDAQLKMDTSDVGEKCPVGDAETFSEGCHDVVGSIDDEFKFNSIHYSYFFFFEAGWGTANFFSNRNCSGSSFNVSWDTDAYISVNISLQDGRHFKRLCNYFTTPSPSPPPLTLKQAMEGTTVQFDCPSIMYEPSRVTLWLPVAIDRQVGLYDGSGQLLDLIEASTTKRPVWQERHFIYTPVHDPTQLRVTAENNKQESVVIDEKCCRISCLFFGLFALEPTTIWPFFIPTLLFALLALEKTKTRSVWMRRSCGFTCFCGVLSCFTECPFRTWMLLGVTSFVIASLCVLTQRRYRCLPFCWIDSSRLRNCILNCLRFDREVSMQEANESLLHNTEMQDEPQSDISVWPSRDPVDEKTGFHIPEDCIRIDFSDFQVDPHWSRQNSNIKLATWGGKKVALKPYHLADLENDLKLRISQEICILHRQTKERAEHVVRLHGISVANGQLYLVLDFLPLTLQDALHKKKLDSTEKLRALFVGVAKGLNSLHKSRVIHRDIKPDNVLLAEDLSEIRLCDFNISKASQGLPFTVPTCTTSHTVSYEAPELWEDDKHRPHSSQDVYSYGVLMRECLTQRRAYGTKTDIEIIKAMKNKQGLSPLCPDELGWDDPLKIRLAEISNACVSPKPSDRPTIEDVLMRLEVLQLNPSCWKIYDEIEEQQLSWKQVDGKVYEDFWNMASKNFPQEAKLKACLKSLSEKYPADQVLQQPCGPGLEDAKQLANKYADELHDKLRTFIVRMGGTYHRAKRKRDEECIEKTKKEYSGNFRRLLDLERSTGALPTLDSFYQTIEYLDTIGFGIPELQLKRFKNRITQSQNGYRDVMINVECCGEFIGEIQLSLSNMFQYKEVAHRQEELRRLRQRVFQFSSTSKGANGSYDTVTIFFVCFVFIASLMLSYWPNINWSPGVGC